MTAEMIAKALGGRKSGVAWIACCPAHKDRSPSLSVKAAEDGKALVHCHAGCGQEQVIAALKARGIWQESGSTSVSSGSKRSTADSKFNIDDLKRTEAALRIWEATVPAGGTPAEVYLRSRGIIIVPSMLRFHPALKHPTGQSWPAMVALVVNGSDGKPLAIHRTFLARDGHGKAPIEPAKMMLGPCRGGAVRLGPVGDRLMVAEGIETALSGMQATGRPTWAALSTVGMRALDLPVAVREVIVLADGDKPGEVAASEAAMRWKREGRRVRIARPPQGRDFNDMLVGRAPLMEAVA
jgi:hypothetical protein